MKYGIVVFPGSNCDEDIYHVLKNVMGLDTVKLWHKDTDTQDCDFLMLPGGFSYGDYLRSGAIARFSPIMKEVVYHAKRGGYVLGICNGFQVLTEAGLLPGGLLHNISQRFICKNVHIKPRSEKALLTKNLDKKTALKIPIAHAEGRYFASEAVIYNLHEHDQVLFKYCNESGDTSEEANPNGSLANIAGVMNKEGNIFGMMPHPERAADTALGNTDGLKILESILNLEVAS